MLNYMLKIFRSFNVIVLVLKREKQNPKTSIFKRLRRIRAA